MGGVCFAVDEDEVRYRRSEGGYGHPGHPPHPHGFPQPGHPGRKMAPPHGMGRGPPPSHGRVPPGGPPGGPPGRFMDEREFMDQKFRPQRFDPHNQGNPTTGDPSRDVFGGRGMRTEKMREFGIVAPSEDSIASVVPGPAFGHHPQAHQQFPPRLHQHSSPQRLQKSPNRQQKSPLRPRQSPSHRPGFENYHDDQMDGVSTAANYQEYISPRKAPTRDSNDGYDVSPERRRKGSKPHGDMPHRRKSLSERLLEYKHRKLTEDNMEQNMELASKNEVHNQRIAHQHDEDTSTQPFMPPSGRMGRQGSSKSVNEYRAKTTSKSADRPDNGTEEDFGHHEQMKRKKSLQERVSEFKERRKNSQVRFDDESVTEASERNDMHRDYYEVLDREAENGHGLDPTHSERSADRDPRKMQKKNSHRGYGFDSGREPSREQPSRERRRKKKSSTDRHERRPETRPQYPSEEDYVKKSDKRRKTREPKERRGKSRNDTSPEPRRKTSGKRKSFIGKPKKRVDDMNPENGAPRRSSRRGAPQDFDSSKKFTFNDDRPKRRVSRRNDRDQHEWAIHE